MIWVAEILLVGPVTVATAWWHSRLIKAERPIRHAWWASMYASLLLIAALLLQQELPGHRIVVFTVACLIGRLIVFNISLNRFRGLSWTYVSATSTSVIDKLSIRLFGSRVWIFEAALAIIFVILQFFIHG